ncbi:uncharacterized protein BDR25DRAFT_277535 [Lindgomyces ingoldianus]|uniref:Uncharacterized protein n=1 Tax=Lindgomyces ingoldianus TaxID=673940 RepID=A0ACB6RAY4_9PLEO|nr:uncharacterized protein BDR25DRAFT_277535 [Lindgomyces ingoldianus]KAF2476429.1 hypothetical protein BDR25DRAFT_277535 [Lindgomyces ingoldianus]
MARGLLSWMRERTLRRRSLGYGLGPSDMPEPPPMDTRSKTWETTVTRVPSWPHDGSPLKKHDWVSYLYLIGDIVLVLLPIYFILLGIAAVTLNGKPTKNNRFGSKVEFAIQLGPTIFPIVFAAISGRSMKMIARYLAERGAKLSTLELLMASQSVWGTVESQLLMRRLTVVGANLLFLWSMSPLGGQASLRLLQKSPSSNFTVAPLRYLSTGPAGTAWAMSTTYVESNGKLTQVTPLYTAALLAPDTIKQGPEDTWGNVKIPRLDLANTSRPDSQGWINLPSNLSSAEDYYSLVGIPIVGRPRDQDSIFRIETTHFTTQCEPFKKMKIAADKNFTEIEQIAPGQIWQNMSTENNPLGQFRTFFLQTDIPLTQGDDGRLDAFFGFVNDSKVSHPFQKRKITYASNYITSSEDSFLNIANCSLAQIHTETEIQCAKAQCFAKRTRISLSDQRPAEFTGFDHSLIAELFLKAFPSTFDWVRGSTPTEQFLFNTSAFPFVSPTTNLESNPAWMDLSLLSAETFSRRLSLLLNTFYQLTIAPNSYLGDLPANFSLYGPDTIPRADMNVYLPSNLSASNTTFSKWWATFENTALPSGISFIGATTNATLSTTQEMYVCNFAWLALLLTAAGVIFLTGAASLVLKRKTLGPELFGFVTSMTYENPYVKVPEGGSMLDAMERARLLKDVELFVADVQGDRDVGHIALAAGVPLRKLERGRLYS